MCWHSLQAPMERVFEQAYRKVHAKAQSHPKPSSTMHFDHFIPRPACFSISSSSFPEGANWLPSHMTCGATAAKGLTQGHSLQAVCLGEAQVSALPASAQIGPWLVPGEPKAQSLLDFFVGFRLRLSSVVWSCMLSSHPSFNPCCLEKCPKPPSECHLSFCLEIQGWNTVKHCGCTRTLLASIRALQVFT